jgi:beta-N-acetylhexosaminidase
VNVSERCTGPRETRRSRPRVVGPRSVSYGPCRGDLRPHLAVTLPSRALASLLAGATVVAVAGCAPHPVPAASPPSFPTAQGAPSQAGSTRSTPATPAGSGSRALLAGNPHGLSDAQLVGQLFMTYVYGATATTATGAQRAANIALYGVPTGAQVVTRWHLGGIILIDHNTLDPERPYLSTANVGPPAQVRALTAGLQRAALGDSNVPLLIATDQEGGRVQRLTQGVTDRPAEQQLAHLSKAALTCSYYTLGQQLRALGINQDFAPVADVVRTATGVIGDRSFGADPRLDAFDTAAAAAGLQAAGVLATLKHWPGHGSTATDSHVGLAVIQETAQQWYDLDRVPFAAAASAGAIMVGHLALPALDPSGRPATLSDVLVAGLLRRGLHYQGLTVTDSLAMEPMRAAGTPGAVAVAALLAGNDLLLESPDVPQAEAQVLHGIQHDTKLRATVQRAVQRLLVAKAAATSRQLPC